MAGAIASLGDINIDLVVEIDRYPSNGDEAFARGQQTRLGGSATNTAVTLARLGLATRMLARVGTDEFGRRATRMLTDNGVDVDWVQHDSAHPTGLNIVLVDEEGERTMVGMRGANVSYTTSPGWEQGATWLHVSGYALLEGPQRDAAHSALATAADSGIPSSVDIPVGVGRRLGEQLRTDMAGAAIVSVGAATLAEISPGHDAVATLLDAGVSVLAITAGPNRLRMASDGADFSLTPPRVEVIDATGAGDAFVAGLIAARMAGLELGPAAVAAATLGAAATRQAGSGAEVTSPVASAELLDPAHWADADPSWIQEAADFLAHRPA